MVDGQTACMRYKLPHIFILVVGNYLSQPITFFLRIIVYCLFGTFVYFLFGIFVYYSFGIFAHSFGIFAHYLFGIFVDYLFGIFVYYFIWYICLLFYLVIVWLAFHPCPSNAYYLLSTCTCSRV